MSDLDQRELRLQKLFELKKNGRNPYEITSFEVSLNSKYIKDNFEFIDNSSVTIAGRLMQRRTMGKAAFANILDSSGSIQIYIKLDNIGKETYDEFLDYDIGDIIGVEGTVFKTHKGEISVNVSKISLLSKSLSPLPEKFHGLKDVDLRYRKRYLDLIMDENVKKTFIKRSIIIKTIRRYLDKLNFIEVETPMLNTIAGGAIARPFVTHHNALNMDLYLRIAPELFLKRLITGGMDRVYEIGRQFRNEGISIKHNPEFTTLELYLAYADYNQMMNLAENIIVACNEAVGNDSIIEYGNEKINIVSPFERLTMIDAVKKYTGEDFSLCMNDEDKVIEISNRLQIDSQGKTKWGDILTLAFEQKVEEKLMNPTFIYDFPAETSPLAKRKKENPMLVERFELYVYGRELANAYSELNDPVDQKERFQEQLKLRDAGDDTASIPDQDFVSCLEYAMPPTGGLGIGIDRLAMLLTNSASIRDVILFPTMKPLDSEKINNVVKQKSESNVKETIDFSKVKVEPLFEEMVDFDTFIKSDFRAVKVISCEEVPKSKKLLKFTLDDGITKNRTILSGIRAYYEPEELIGKTLIAILNLPPRSMMGFESCGMLISAVHEEDGGEKLHLLMVDDGIPAGAKLC